MKRGKHMKANGSNFSGQNGSTIVGVMAALVFVGVIATFMVVNTKTQSATSLGYSSLQTMSASVSSALVATEQYLKLQPNDALQKIQSAWNDSEDWIIGSDHSKAQIGSSKQFLSSKIIDFNNQFIATIEARGYIGGNNRPKMSRGMYHLSGVQLTANSQVQHALYLAGNARHFDQPIHVHGDVYVGGSVHFNEKAAGSNIYGTFRNAYNALASTCDGSVTFHQNVLFETNVKTNSTGNLTFKAHAGFERDLGGDGTIKFEKTALGDDNNIYINGSRTGNSKWDINFNPLLHSGSISMSDLVDANSTTVTSNGGNIDDIPTRLGMSATPPPEPSIDLSKIDGPIHDITSLYVDGLQLSNWNGGDLEEVYKKKKDEGQLWNDYLVVRVNDNKSMNSTGLAGRDNTFTKKVIFIVESDWSINGNFYTSGAEANTLVVQNSGTITGFGCNGLFRGFVYAQGTEMIYNWGVNAELQGALHQRDPDTKFQMNSGNPLTIRYNTEPLNEIATLGIMRDSDGNDIVAELEVSSTIDPELLAVYHY